MNPNYLSLPQLLATAPGEDLLSVQRLVDQHRRRLDSMDKDQQAQRSRQMADLQAKLASRQERKRREGTRKLEELSTQKFVSEQNEQMSGIHDDGDMESGVNLAHMPSVTYLESSEELAMKRQQERQQEELKKRHQAERDQLAVKLDTDSQKQEQDLAKQLEQQVSFLLYFRNSYVLVKL